MCSESLWKGLNLLKMLSSPATFRGLARIAVLKGITILLRKATGEALGSWSIFKTFLAKMVTYLRLRQYVRLKRGSHLVGWFLNVVWDTLGTREEKRNKVICHTNCPLEQPSGDWITKSNRRKKKCDCGKRGNQPVQSDLIMRRCFSSFLHTDHWNWNEHRAML